MARKLSVASMMALATVLAAAAWASVAEYVNLDSVLAELAERQARVTSLTCSWTRTSRYPSGCLFVLDENEQRVPGVLAPEEDTELESSYSVRIQGDRVAYRVEREVPDWTAADTEDRARAVTTGVWVDGQGRELIAQPGGEHPFAAVSAHASFLALSAFNPIRFAYRLMDARLGRLHGKDLRFIGRSSVDGHSCLVVEADGEETVERWWLAEDMGYLPVRWQLLRRPGMQVLQQLSVQYEPGGPMGWQLESWELTSEPSTNRLLPITSVSQVEELTADEPVPDEEFLLRFPVGTEVYDDFDQEMYEVESWFLSVLKGEEPRDNP
jgi:hypothetical protein